MRRRGAAGLLNVLTIALLAMTCALVAGYVALLVNPSAPFNPFPPRSPMAVVELPPTTAPGPGAEGETPTATLVPFTDTPQPTATLAASPTFTEIVPTTPVATLAVILPASPLPSPTRTESPFRFTVQGDAPIAVKNVFNQAGCAWMGIGGQVYDLNDRPIIAYVVHLEGGGRDEDSLTGSKPQYGPGGYEFRLADEPKQTTGVYRIQLRDAQGAGLSDWIPIDTYGDCLKNVLVVNFLQNH